MLRRTAQNTVSGMTPRARRAVVGAAFMLLLMPLLGGAAHAGSDLRRGTVGALELQLPVGARSSALGGATAADVAGAEAIYWNPAGLANSEHTEVLFTHTRYIADMKLNYAALGVYTEKLGVFGFNAKVLSLGDVIVTTEDAPEGTGEILTPTFSVLGVTWARQFTDRVLFGGTVNYVNESVANVDASGMAFDFGVQYVTRWHDMRFGMVMKNIGPSMEFSGPGLETSVLPPDAEQSASTRVTRATSASFEMPSSFTLSGSFLAVSGPTQKLTVLGAFQNNNFSGDVMRGAAEWMYRDQFALRGSVFGSINSIVDATSGDETTDFVKGEQVYSGYALGAGATIKSGDAGLIGLDIAWRPVKNFFDDTLEFGLHIAF